jgi:hypothetical protein
MERPIELAITAAAESVPCGLTAGGGERGDAGEAGEGGLGAQPAAMRPGDDQLRGDDRPDAWLVEQRGRECADVGEDLPFETRQLLRLLPRFGERGCARRAVSRARRAELSSSGGGGYSARAALRSAARGGSSRSRSGAVTITPRSCPSASRRTSTALRRATSKSRSASRRSPLRGSARASPGKGCPRRPRRVERVVLAAQASLGPRGTADLEHGLATAGEVKGKSGAVAAGALDRPGREHRGLPPPRSAAPLRSRLR